MDKETVRLSTSDSHKSANEALRFYDGELAHNPDHITGEELDFNEAALLDPKAIHKAVKEHRSRQAELERTIDLSFEGQI